METKELRHPKDEVIGVVISRLQRLAPPTKLTMGQ